MRIFSTSDWHYCAGLDEDVDRSIRQMIKIARDDKADIIVIPGDIYHRPIGSDPDGRNLASARMQEFAEIGPVFIAYGNHDAQGDLEIFEHLASKHSIQVHSLPQTVHCGPYDEEVLLHLLPWITKANWSALHPEASKSEGDRTVSQLVLQYVKTSLVRSGHPNGKHILVGHLTVAGAKAENQQPLIGEGITLGQYDLREAGYWAGIFGHIHLRQSFLEGRFYYNGSPAPLNYGESPDKYCSILDTNTSRVEWFKLETIDRFSFDLGWLNGGPIHSVELESSRIPGSRVRINLKIPEGEDLAFAKRYLTERMELHHALEVKINPQVIPKEAIRSSHIVSAVSLEDKLKAYWQATNTTPDTETQVDMLNKLKIAEEKCFRSN